MSLCAMCGLTLASAALVCPWHHATDDDWAATNRILCDLFHRGIAPRRLTLAERVDPGTELVYADVA